MQIIYHHRPRDDDTEIMYYDFERKVISRIALLQYIFRKVKSVIIVDESGNYVHTDFYPKNKCTRSRRNLLLLPSSNTNRGWYDCNRLVLTDSPHNSVSRPIFYPIWVPTSTLLTQFGPSDSYIPPWTFGTTFDETADLNQPVFSLLQRGEFFSSQTDTHTLPVMEGYIDNAVTNDHIRDISTLNNDVQSLNGNHIIGSVLAGISADHESQVTIQLVVWTRSIVLKMCRHDHIEKIYQIANLMTFSNSEEIWGVSLRSISPLHLALQPRHTLREYGIGNGTVIFAYARLLGGGTVSSEVILHLQSTIVASS